MSSSQGRIFFGPFEVTTQVFLTTPLSFALVNLKPLLPGHVLVCPRKGHKRLTDLSAAEVTDLFTTVQKVQRMLARHYFPSPSSSGGGAGGKGRESDQKEQGDRGSEVPAGAFNIALQDGPEAGQTVAHVHVHVIPRIRGATAKDAASPADAIYDRMAGEEGNVGGAQWDAAAAAAASRGTEGSAPLSQVSAPRPRPGGKFPLIEDWEREARSLAEMEDEAGLFRDLLEKMEKEEEEENEEGPGRRG